MTEATIINRNECLVFFHSPVRYPHILPNINDNDNITGHVITFPSSPIETETIPLKPKGKNHKKPVITAHTEAVILPCCLKLKSPQVLFLHNRKMA